MSYYYKRILQLAIKKNEFVNTTTAQIENWFVLPTFLHKTEESWETLIDRQILSDFETLSTKTGE